MKIFQKAAAKTQSILAPRELSQAELNGVSGGLNPQPLPPSHDPHETKNLRQ